MVTAKRKYLIAAALILLLRCSRKHSAKWENRNTWSKTWISRRETHGVYQNLVRELSLEDEALYRSCMRMLPESFNAILELVGPQISKQNTRKRAGICPDQRLAITLRFLATGKNVVSQNSEEHI